MLAPALLALLPLAACGGDDPDPGETGGSGGCGANCNEGGSGGAGGDGAGAGGAGGTGGAGGSGGAGGGAPADIRAQLEAIDGLELIEEPSGHDGYRYFEITLDQPVDHANPDAQRFQQRIHLHHRDASAPLVLAATGYNLWGGEYLEEPTMLLEANQLVVEHRYFTPSRPVPTDWALLDIAQAAADHHRIVSLIRPLYEGAWISTGASKGGMTSVYHRRFYPDDVDGTVAYVAPLSFGTDDPRYVTFLDQVGTDAACRQKLQDFQRELLLRRDVMLDRMNDLVAQGATFDLMGIEATLETAVIDLEFTFWQYGGEGFCGAIPTSTSSDDEVWEFFNALAGVIGYSDTSVLQFEPYYWQALTQLGAPGIDTSHLDDLLQIDQDALDIMPSIPEDPVFEPEAMQDIHEWVTTEAERILFIYGETDPWTAGAFEVGAAVDSYLYVAPGANHGAGILSLDDADQEAALGHLAAWTGVPVTQPLVHASLRQRMPTPPALRLVRRALSR
ncbi:Hypothetical protein CAP_0223 [Chondromyces apiculatus DSM 436]|uniref:Secreted tripeptidyl aminopeptidase n=2 Tax=Chondromyces apiculatus TaxID=51 RepID=A0A017TF73_9BACT|nr:Hypothetical protein CAP_0223 [Chondromyces apiculatus DSM 436]